jgi:hypothetical protein
MRLGMMMDGEEINANDVPAWPGFNVCAAIGLHQTCADA